MILVLIGYRGTGKSAVGKILGARLGLPCLAVDELVERKAGMAIPEIVARGGWQRFRDLESEAAREVGMLDEVIVDTGGGFPERPENLRALGEKSCVIWLKAEVETIVPRIASGNQRPALTQGKSFTEEVADILERRTPIYREAAQHQIDTDRLTPEEVADRIARIWESLKRTIPPA